MRVITVAEAGEFGLVDRVIARLQLPPGAGAPADAGPVESAPAAATGLVELGPGDDAAVLSTPDGRVVASTDLLVDGRHFRRDWSTGYDVGRKAAAQNL